MAKKMKQKNNHMKTISLLFSVLVVVAAFVIYFDVGNHPTSGIDVKQAVQIDGMYFANPTEISEFKLTDNAGQAFTKDSLKHHWTLMFFGFTNCGMVCPTTMSALNKMYLQLQKELPADKMPQVVMVSVDPDRDTVERMNEYVTSFNPHFIGARADMSEIDMIKKQLHLVSAKMKTGDGKDQYTINHSAEIMVFNPDAKLQAYLAYPHTADALVKDYKSLLANSSL